ncbi:amino acid lyase [Anaerocolumna cellulosilytica]|uniref:Amino acid lyase n=1 Tax=Anaerocolumna cellulosilytica TaxID=433286 RepID=A0A6S6QYE9_9FIRM|nr:aminotransferase class I/II-fold pyridoxal phosphate-dependent enzyme [Anaerocolumna cellulosilytica]MBB5194938.1 threonine aldolase [Anaerocolumna cellulosilytica]BCJ94099.1 amino acid lyase [Anaerocolumna cellulosilytica]
MYSFMNDYSEGAHKRILELLASTSLEQNNGYGEDKHTKQAKKYINNLLGPVEADIHLIPGGTQTNLLVISAFLRPHQCVIAADTGHINVHETGAIEATGHKVLAMPCIDGKLTPEVILQALKTHSDEHMVQPKMVYISNTTELGTIYSKAELIQLSKVCRERGLILYLDGARLASALTCKENDLTLSDLADLTDAFYIGGTKNGALLGEALVLTKEELKEDFRFLIKQRGALMAKGFILGIQFEALFEDDLYFTLGRHSNAMAKEIERALQELGVSFLAPPMTNQLFPILPIHLLKELEKEFTFSVQKEIDEKHSAIRFVTSWATTQESVAALCSFLKKTLT